MNTNQGKSIVKTASNVWVASVRRVIAGIEQAKWTLAVEFGKTFQLPERLFRVAVNEAEALAWETGFPHLVFPVLAEEKVQKASAWYGGEFLDHRDAVAA
jgi:hypothetical protein